MKELGYAHPYLICDAITWGIAGQRCMDIRSRAGVDGGLLKNTFLYCKEVRARYTILQLVWDLGLLDRLSDQVISGLKGE